MNLRAPWLSCALALLSAGSWSLAYANLIGGALQLLVDLFAGPVAITGLAIGIVAVTRRWRSLAIGAMGIVLSVGAIAYIGFGFLRIVAMAGFA